MILLFYLSDSTSKVFCFPTLTDLLSTSNAIGWWYFIFMKNLVNRTEYSNSSWSKITSPGSLKLGIRFDSPVLSECYLYLSTQRSVQNFFTLTVKQLGMWEDLWQYTKAMRNTENRRRLMYYQLGKNNPKVYRIIANIKKTLNVAFFLPKPSFGVFTVHGLLFCLRTYWFPLEILESEGASLTSGPVMSTVAMMR